MVELDLLFNTDLDEDDNGEDRNLYKFYKTALGSGTYEEHIPTTTHNYLTASPRAHLHSTSPTLPGVPEHTTTKWKWHLYEDPVWVLRLMGYRGDPIMTGMFRSWAMASNLSWGSSQAPDMWHVFGKFIREYTGSGVYLTPVTIFGLPPCLLQTQSLPFKDAVGRNMRLSVQFLAVLPDSDMTTDVLTSDPIEDPSELEERIRMYMVVSTPHRVDPPVWITLDTNEVHIRGNKIYRREAEGPIVAEVTRLEQYIMTELPEDYDAAANAQLYLPLEDDLGLPMITDQHISYNQRTILTWRVLNDSAASETSTGHVKISTEWCGQEDRGFSPKACIADYPVTRDESQIGKGQIYIGPPGENTELPYDHKPGYTCYCPHTGYPLKFVSRLRNYNE